MKKSLFLLAFLPLVALGDSVVPSDMLVSVWSYKYNASGSFTAPTIADLYATKVPVSFLSDYFFSRGFGLSFASGGSVTYPAASTVSVGSLTNATRNQWFNIQGTNGVWYSLVKSCPEIVSYAHLCSRLYAGGYRGAGFSNVFTNSSGGVTCNVFPATVLSEILNGTNTVYRSLLFSSLASISSGVLSIDSGVSQLVPAVESVREVNIGILSNSVDIVSNTLDIIDALIGDYPEEEPARKGGAKGPYNDVRTSIKSQLQAWRNQATTQLSTWKVDLSNQLEAWKTSDETGYLNIRKKIDDQFGTKKIEWDHGVPVTNILPYTSFVTQQVVQVITNVIDRSVGDAARNITSNASQNAQDNRNFLQRSLIDPLFDPTGPGVNVNIQAPLYGSSMAEVNVHDKSLDVWGVSIAATLDGFEEWIGDYYDSSLDKWDIWFGKWDSYAQWWEDEWEYYRSIFEPSRTFWETYAAATSNQYDSIDFANFDSSDLANLNWFERVEVLLRVIANVQTGAVEVADIGDDMTDQLSAFEDVGTNLVSASSRVVGFFDYVTRFSTSLKNAFRSSSAPVTSGIVLLQGDNWFTADQPLVLRVDINVQNACRLGAQCIWYCGAFVVIWLVVSWAWSKVLAVCRWLWSLFDI